jgi:TonB family protein
MAGEASKVWTVVTSIAIHAGLLGGCAYLVNACFHRAPAPVVSMPEQPPEPINVELPEVFEGTLIADRVDDSTGEPPKTFGGDTVARVDTGRPGRGGDARGQRATHLADADDHFSRTRDLLDRLDRDQEQRLATARTRQSFDDRRTSRDPMELTFLATGSGTLEERRKHGRNPSRGALESQPASVRGGEPGHLRDDAEPGDPAREGASVEGSTQAHAGQGLRTAEEGKDHRASADTKKGRPLVDQAAVSIAASVRGRPTDTVDSDQEVANALRSIVHASVAGGNGDVGPGGTTGGGAAGAGGASGAGSQPRPLGDGQGETYDFNTHDPRLVPYFRELHKKIDPLWRNAFPYEAKAALKQGTVIIEFVVEADGSARVLWPARRPSGIDEFDKNCRDAILNAAPFPRIPASLGVSRLRIIAPFSASNPAVN